MKTYPFIVINKNDMTELAHFATADRVAVYLLGRKLENIIVLINEQSILALKDVPSTNVNTIERILVAKSKERVVKSIDLCVQEVCGTTTNGWWAA